MENLMQRNEDYLKAKGGGGGGSAASWNPKWKATKPIDNVVPKPKSPDLDKILAKIEGHNLDVLTPQEIISINPELKEAKAAIEALINERVVVELEKVGHRRNLIWHEGAGDVVMYKTIKDRIKQLTKGEK